jgi:phosphate/sulfate permease
MLNFIKSMYRGFMEIVFCIIPIGCAIVGGVIGYASERGNDNGYMHIGVLIGIVVGILIDVLGGGLVATFLSMEEKLQHIDEKLQRLTKSTKNG